MEGIAKRQGIRFALRKRDGSRRKASIGALAELRGTGGENAMLYEEIRKSFKNYFLLYVYNDLPVHHFHSRGK